MKAVEDLLDRSNEGIEQKESAMNEYLSSFKVTSFCVLFYFNFVVIIFQYMLVAFVVDILRACKRIFLLVLTHVPRLFEERQMWIVV